MILLSIHDLHKSFGVNEVLRGVSLTLQTGERMGLVGVNGCGKTTLMRVIAGLEEYDEGELHLNRGTRIGYMAQQADFDGMSTIHEAMAHVFDDVQVMEARMGEMERAMSEREGADASLLDEYARLRDRFEALDGYAWRSRVAGVLAGLKFSRERYDQPIHQLSGGERTRLGLARLLLQNPDLLLLDEPTNHLDLESLSWLEEYLNAYKGTVLIISHDRYFMDHVCTCMAELLMGRVEQYGGNYSAFIRRREEAFEIRMKAYTMQQREIARQQEIIARYRSFNREKSIKAAESREKALARIQRLEKPVDEKQVRFRFEARRRTGEDVLLLDKLSKRYDERELFHEFSLRVRAGDRIAIIGSNGIGKSTLLKCVTGEVTPDSGFVRWGTNVDMGYYDQHQQALHDDKLVIDEIWDDFPSLEQYEVRGALGLFLFIGDDVFMPVGTLSGGERGRLALTRLMLRRDNLLLLDEPTNHLDMESRQVLEKALDEFTGTIIAVSHDRYFINRFATRVIEMRADGAVEYIGNYDDYLEKLNRPQAPDDDVAGRTRTELNKARKKERARLLDQRAARDAVTALERDIASAEEEVRRLESLMADSTLYADAERARQIVSEHKQAQIRVEDLYEQWARAAEAIEGV